MSSNISVCRRSKINNTITLLLAGISLLIGDDNLSGTYTIGDGGDYATFTDAVLALNTYGITGPVTFDALDGIYEESIAIGPIAGTSIDNTITFKSQSDNADNVVIQYMSTSSSNNWLVKLDNSDYNNYPYLYFVEEQPG